MFEVDHEYEEWLDEQERNLTDDELFPSEDALQ